MRYLKLGTLIRKVEGVKNKQLKNLPLLGISIDKEFMPSVANTIGTDMSNYQIVRRNQFACNPMHLGRDERMPTALLQSYDEILVSPAYFVFEVADENLILPEYLMLYFRQSETDRLLWFKTDSSVRGGLGYNEMCDINIPVPSIERQREIVTKYNQINEAIAIKERLNNNLEQQAQALFKSWFVDFEPFGSKMPDDWKIYKLGDFLPVITGKKNANVSSSEGKYLFFSCSQDIAWTDSYSFEGNAILVAGNGDFNIKFYNGKFEAYQRTYVLIPYKQRYTDWLYYAVKHNLSTITSNARGSVISFITKGNLENFEFAAPSNLENFNIVDVFLTINKCILQNKRENEKLVTLRDALLPKLMSGEIDVSKVNISADKLSFTEL